MKWGRRAEVCKAGEMMGGKEGSNWEEERDPNQEDRA